MQDALINLTQRLGVIPTAMAAALCVMLGIIIIIHPPLLAWLAGIALVLTGVAIFTAVMTSAGR